MTTAAMLDGQLGLPIAVLLDRRGSLGGTLATPVGGPPERKYDRVRSDSLPEQTRYRDDGCEVNPSCLTCPLPRCRYDEPGGLRGLVNGMRDRKIAAMRLKGAPVEDIADRFHLSKRTIFRILEMNGQPRREARCA